MKSQHDKVFIGLLKIMAIEILVAVIMYMILIISILTWGEKF
jgi:hypothetical protein